MKKSKSKLIEQKLSVADLKRRFEFDLKEGAIFSKTTGKRLDVLHHFKGQSTSNSRYKQVQFQFDGETVKIAAHRMIWAVVKGRWSKDGMVIDHKNSNTLDNRPGNLEEVTQTENIRRGRKQKGAGEVKTLKGRIAELVSRGVAEDKAREIAIAEMTKKP